MAPAKKKKKKYQIPFSIPFPTRFQTFLIINHNHIRYGILKSDTEFISRVFQFAQTFAPHTQERKKPIFLSADLDEIDSRDQQQTTTTKDLIQDFGWLWRPSLPRQGDDDSEKKPSCWLCQRQNFAPGKLKIEEAT